MNSVYDKWPGHWELNEFGLREMTWSLGVKWALFTTSELVIGIKTFRVPTERVEWASREGKIFFICDPAGGRCVTDPSLLPCDPAGGRSVTDPSLCRCCYLVTQQVDWQVTDPSLSRHPYLVTLLVDRAVTDGGPRVWGRAVIVLLLLGRPVGLSLYVTVLANTREQKFKYSN